MFRKARFIGILNLDVDTGSDLFLITDPDITVFPRFGPGADLFPRYGSGSHQNIPIRNPNLNPKCVYK